MPISQLSYEEKKVLVAENKTTNNMLEYVLTGVWDVIKDYCTVPEEQKQCFEDFKISILAIADAENCFNEHILDMEKNKINQDIIHSAKVA